MLNNANRLQKLNEIASVLDACEAEDALAILNSYATLRGLQVGGSKGTTPPKREDTRSRSSSQRNIKGKQPEQVNTGSNRATVRVARERELNMTVGQVIDATTRLLNIQKKFKGKEGSALTELAQKYGLEPASARQEIGRAVQLCQDLTTWLNGRSWFDRNTGKKTDSMPALTDSFRRLMGDEGCSTGRNSQDEVAKNPS